MSRKRHQFTESEGNHLLRSGIGTLYSDTEPWRRSLEHITRFPELLAVLEASKRKPKEGKKLFEGLALRRCRMEAFAERRDLTKTERQLREQVTRQIWSLKHRTFLPVEGMDEIYEAAMKAVYYPGQRVVLEEMAEQRRQLGDTLSGGAPLYDCFDGRTRGVRAWRTPVHLRNVRTLIGLAEDDGTIPFGNEVFLGMFDADYLEYVFRSIEDIGYEAVVEQMMSVYGAAGGSVERTASILLALLAIPDRKPPDEAWFENTRSLANKEPLFADERKSLSLLGRLWRIPIEMLRRREFHSKSQAFEGVPIARASVWAVGALGGRGPQRSDSGAIEALMDACNDWVSIPDYGSRIASAAVRSISHVGGERARSSLEQLRASISNKTVLRTIANCLSEF